MPATFRRGARRRSIRYRLLDTNEAASDDRFVVRLQVVAGVRREIDFEVRQFQGFEDVLTVLVGFDCDALDVDPGGGGMTMPKRVCNFLD